VAATIKVGADLGPAQKAVDDFQASLKISGAKAGETLARGIETGADKAATSLKKIETSADSAAKSTKKLLEMETVDRYVGALGPLKEIWTQTGEAIFGVKKETVETGAAMMDLSEKGAAFGKLLGPWGALAGAALGAVAGYFTSASKAAAAAQAETKQLTADAKETNASFSTLGEIDLSSLIDQLGKLELRLKSAKSGGEDARKEIQGLAEKGVDALAEGFTKLAGGYAREAEGLGITAVTGEIWAAEKRIAAIKNEAEGERERMLQATKEWGENSAEDLKKWQDRLLDLSNQQAEQEEKLAAYQARLVEIKGPIEAIVPPIVSTTEALEDQRITLEELEKLIPVAVSIGDALLYVRDGYAEINAKQREIPDLIGLDDVNPDKLKAQTDAEIERLNAELPPIELPMYIKPITAEDGPNPLQGFADASQDALKDLKATVEDVFVDTIAASFDLMVGNLAKGERAFKGLGNVIAETGAKAAKSLGKKWALQAGGEAADAIAALAIGNVPGAILHGQAALAYGLMAAAAGVGAGLLGRAGGGTEGGTAAAAPSFSSSGSVGGGGQQGGTASFQELAAVQYNLAPGGTVVFPGDNRGMAALGRFNNDASKAGRAGAPGVVR